MPWVRIASIWLAYGSGVAAGLTVIGHAAGIATITGCNLVDSLLSGWLSDRISHRSILTILPLFSATALLTLSVLPGQTIALLGVVGFAYGAATATYPTAIARLFPGEDGPFAYGRIFTTSGVAGLLAPWLAGQIYDRDGSYTHALWVAAGRGNGSAFIAQRITSQT